MRAFLLCFALVSTAIAQKPAVSVQYFHDEDRSRLTLSDLEFSSPSRGIAVGVLETEGKGTQPVALLTVNGGDAWSQVKLKKAGISLFLLDDSHYWMVTLDGVWFSDEGGRDWRKLSNPKGALRVHFLTPERGFAVGVRKKVWETRDGGKKWTEVAAAASAKGDPEVTSYTCIAFANETTGVIAGHVRPRPKRQWDRDLPAWVDPEAATRRVVPRVEISLDTRDGGETWTTGAASLFGSITAIRFSPLQWGLGLVRFQEGFTYPAEVYRLNWKTGANERVYRDKSFNITDIALAGPSGPSYLVGVEQLGPLIESPIPRRVRVFRSVNLTKWDELEVDFRASATFAHAAMAGETLWLATDTGMILKFRP